MTYPTTKTTFTDPAGTTLVDTGVDHAQLHTDHNDTVEAIEDVLGTTAGTSVLKNFAAGEFPVRATGGGAIGTLQQTLAYGDNAPIINPKARVYSSGTQSVPPSAWTLVQNNTEDYDIGSDFNTSTYLFTIPTTGYYSLKGQVTITSLLDTEVLLGSFQINGGATILTEAKLIASATGNYSLNFSDTVKLTVGDTLGLYVYHTNAGSLGNFVGQRYQYISIHLISI